MTRSFRAVFAITLFLTASVLFAASHAHAQTEGLQAPGYGRARDASSPAKTAAVVVLDETAAMERMQGAYDAALSEVKSTLDALGLKLKPVPPRKGPGTCNESACLGKLGRKLKVDLAAGIALQPAEASANAAATVTVILARSSRDAQKEGVSAHKQVFDGHTQEAAQKATLEAWRLLGKGQGPYLQVTGSPKGALVDIDGVDVGTLPFEGPVAEGKHTAHVTSPGYAPQSLPFSAGPRPDQITTLSVHLKPGGATKAQSAADEGGDMQTKGEPGPLADWLVAGGLAAAGVGLLVSPIMTAVNDGNEVGERRLEDGVPTRTVENFGRRSIGLTVGGSLFLAAAAAVAIFQPIRRVRTKRHEEAQATAWRLRPDFNVARRAQSAGLQLEGAF